MNSRWYFKREKGVVYLVVEELAEPHRGYRLHVLAPGERFSPFLRHLMLAHIKGMRENIAWLDARVDAPVRTYDPVEADVDAR